MKQCLLCTTMHNNKTYCDTHLAFITKPRYSVSKRDSITADTVSYTVAGKRRESSNNI